MGMQRLPHLISSPKQPIIANGMDWTGPLRFICYCRAFLSPFSSDCGPNLFVLWKKPFSSSTKVRQCPRILSTCFESLNFKLAFDSSSFNASLHQSCSYRRFIYLQSTTSRSIWMCIRNWFCDYKVSLSSNSIYSLCNYNTTSLLSCKIP